MSLFNVFNVSGSGMNAQNVRLNTTASNLANAQSVSSSIEQTYRARQPVFNVAESRPFENDFYDYYVGKSASAGVEVLGIVESDAPLQTQHNPNHPAANEDGYVFYPNVNVVEEMANMISASRSFQMNVEVMNSAKSMMQRLLALGQ